MPTTRKMLLLGYVREIHHTDDYRGVLDENDVVSDYAIGEDNSCPFEAFRRACESFGHVASDSDREALVDQLEHKYDTRDFRDVLDATGTILDPRRWMVLIYDLEE